MDTNQITDIGVTTANTVAVTSQLAQVAAPIVSIYNPAAGALLSSISTTLGPIISSFIISETEIIVKWNKDMSKDEMIKVLESSKSANWGPVEPIA